MTEIFLGVKKPIIGYVQLGGLTEEGFDYSFAKGVVDAAHLERGGVDAIVVENYNEPEEGAKANSVSKEYMRLICQQIRRAVKCAKLGINVLPADLEAAFELAYNYSFDFVHADVYADKVVSRETGKPIEVDLDRISQTRRELDYSCIPLIATIKPWHVYDVIGDESIEDSAKRAVDHGADAIVVVGRNGVPPEIDEIGRVKAVVPVPVGAGSGITSQRMRQYWPEADFFLVSREFKYLDFDGRKDGLVEEYRVRKFMETVSILGP